MLEYSLTGKRAAIVGLARSGVAAARLARRLGAEVWLCDGKPAEAFTAQRAELDGISTRIEFGGPSDATLAACDLLVISPGVPLALPALRRAAARGQELIGETELAVRCLGVPLLGITGTNGKTTTAALAAHLLQGAGRSVFLGGNIGRPLSLLALQALEGSNPAELAVIELSSFQLEAAPSLKPRVAAWLNLSEDHLDRYAGFEQYARAKANIFNRQSAEDWALIPANDPRIAGYADRGRARRATFGPGGMVQADETALSFDLPGVGAGRIDVSGFQLIGGHNLLNLAAAAAVALLSGAQPAALERAAAGFKPLPHRLESVGVVRGVRFVNDSKATTPDSVRVALESFDEPVVLIAGGRDKGMDFTVLRGPAQARLSAAVLIGEAADKLEAALRGAARLERADKFEDAVRRAFELAAPGGVVLLSPACASFDMFSDYEDRGRQFAQAVELLRREAQ